MISKNNQRENLKRKPHQYTAGDTVWFKQEERVKFGGSPWEGPFPVLQVNTNGTLRIQRGAIIETVNMRNIKPHVPE